jgi:general secretion pathway protein A
MSTVLIVDEAHLLSEELLEEIRLLSNLETYDDKLLHIVLVGQPELDEKLDSKGLRQLKQRIALRTHLDPLNFEETKRYIEHRLDVASLGSSRDSLFGAKAVAMVYRFSRGFPRLINTICENTLITAYARQTSTITPEIVRTVARELRLDSGLRSEKEQSDSDEIYARHSNGHCFDLAHGAEQEDESDPEQARL